MEELVPLLPYFWEGFKIGLLIMIPIELIRFIIFLRKKKDIHIINIKDALKIFPLIFGLIFAFVDVKDE